MFIAVLFTSESSQQFRYTDDGDLVELCKWTVDLGSLPPFQQHAASQAAAMGQGFYTEFELGLELDSAEVRGVLLYNNQVGLVKWSLSLNDLTHCVFRNGGVSHLTSSRRTSAAVIVEQYGMAHLSRLVYLQYAAHVRLLRIGEGANLWGSKYL